MKLTKNASENPISPSAEDDRHLFKLLFKQHASGIYRMANNLLRSRVEAQEVVQECFLKYWEKRHTISADPATIRGYLYTSAYHAVLLQVRRQRRWVYQDYPEDLIVEQEPQTIALEHQELTVLYTHALAQLPTKRRLVFAMSRQQGLSNAMIAQELNISVKMVEAQITQALKFLRTYFRAHGIVLTLVLLLLEG
ncbi:sigma-70 family RNA polymerase sigma factor [Hymenobacter crusticola]|uniref:RNA polymerase sigma-70 factor n=1 Tax=Hymenobacter crusticola TaxID=1770526 RepID=A0A243W6L2_9BACT|nr:sigma-70 family RNA polymerase sigma factor [Hymenobacter crusticola]OUJ69791.1 hypothetical protein BXP70_26135 [Hymenobacter crusticola]